MPPKGITYNPPVEHFCAHCGVMFVAYACNKRRYCSRSCEVLHRQQSGSDNPYWRGGRYVTDDGYIKVYVGGAKYASEHRLIMEQHLGHPIPEGFDVHHLNGIKTDNRIENLQVMTKSEHMRLHKLAYWATRKK